MTVYINMRTLYCLYYDIIIKISQIITYDERKNINSLE